MTAAPHRSTTPAPEAGRAWGRRARLGRGLAVVVTAGAAAVVAVPAAAATGGTITGTVTGGGRPLAGVVVEAGEVLGTTPPFFDVAATAVTRADGTYRLTGLPGSELVVQFEASSAVGGTSATGYGDSCWGGSGTCLIAPGGTGITVRGGQTRKGVDAKLAPAGSVKGRLTDALGRGVGGVSVQLFTGGNDQGGDSFDPVYRTTTSDVNGNYRLPQLFAHSYTLCFGTAFGPSGGTPNRDGYVGTCPSTSVPVTAGGVVADDVRLSGLGGVTGTVVDTSGAPVVGATVSYTVGLTWSSSTTTSAKGTFRLGAVEPGRITVHVDAPRFASRNIKVTAVELSTVATGRIVLSRVS